MNVRKISHRESTDHEPDAQRASRDCPMPLARHRTDDRGEHRGCRFYGTAADGMESSPRKQAFGPCTPPARSKTPDSSGLARRLIKRSKFADGSGRRRPVARLVRCTSNIDPRSYSYRKFRRMKEAPQERLVVADRRNLRDHAAVEFGRGSRGESASPLPGRPADEPSSVDTLPRWPVLIFYKLSSSGLRRP